jgi:integrase
VGRPAKPWFRKQTGWWMLEVNDEQIKLSKDKDEAFRKFHEMMVTRHEAPESPMARVADIVEAFLAWASTHVAESTYDQYKWYGQKLSEDCGQQAARDFKPIHVTRWIDKRGWHGAHEYNGRRYTFRFFSWAMDEGVLAKNPLRGMKRPKPKPRQRALTDTEYLAMLRASDSDFRPFLFALKQTGARPKELRQLTWDKVHGDHLILWEHKTDGSTTAPRVIHLTQPMQKMLALFRKRSESKYVFLNGRGKPWTMNAVRLRVMRLKKKLGLNDDVCVYLLRHAFGTNAIVNGVDPLTVAELMGHSDLTMIKNVYAHLSGQKSHLQDAVTRAAARPLGASRNQGA